MINSVNLREIVLDILTQVSDKGDFSHLTINDALTKYQYLDKNQRAFIGRLSIGTIECRIELDYILDRFSKTPVKKMKPLIRNVCEMSVYQIIYMDNVPDSAVCNEAVKLVSKRGFSGLKGYVNGLLRNIARNKDMIEYPDMSVKYSMPQWIIDLWKQYYDDETIEDILKGFRNAKRTYIRCNTNKVDVEHLVSILEQENVSVKRVPDIEYALEISGFDYISGLKSFNDGLYFIQDISSIRAGYLAGFNKGDYCIDMCAAPGGKALNAALLVGKIGHVTARDISEYKVSLIESNINRLGIDNIRAQVFDATVRDDDNIGKADVVIADLPCSGLGVIGRKPDIKYNISKDKLGEIVRLQRSILQNAVLYLKPDGVLIYSTCTINRAENEENADWICKTFGFERVAGDIMMLPKADVGGDGFYVARLRKCGESNG